MISHNCIGQDAIIGHQQLSDTVGFYMTFSNMWWIVSISNTLVSHYYYPNPRKLCDFLNIF